MTADANLFYENGALLDQIELQLADLEENAAQVETAAQLAAADKITVAPFARRKPALRRLPELTRSRCTRGAGRRVSGNLLRAI